MCKIRTVLILSVCGIVTMAHAQVLKVPAKTLSIKKTITVRNPRADTVWTIGKRITIEWTTTGPEMAYVQILLFPADGAGRFIKPPPNVRVRRYTIADKTGNRGSFSWVVPKSIRPGNYAVVVANLKNTVQGNSPVFTIKEVFKLKLPNLVITGEYMGWSNPPEDPEDTGYVKVRVTNTRHPDPKFPAGGSAYEFKIKVENGNDPSEYYITSGVDLATLNSQGWAEKTIGLWDPGWFPLKLTVDCTGMIAETNEGDNTFTVPTPAEL